MSVGIRPYRQDCDPIVGIVGGPVMNPLTHRKDDALACGVNGERVRLLIVSSGFESWRASKQ